MRSDVAFIYVRELLSSMTGERPEPDHDGDLPVFFNGAAFYVRILGSNDPLIQIFSVAIDALDESPELYARLNNINQNLQFARAFHVGRQVLIESEIWASDLNPANFHYACRNIATATDSATPMLTELGGTPRFETSKSEDYTTSKGQMTFPGWSTSN